MTTSSKRTCFFILCLLTLCTFSIASVVGSTPPAGSPTEIVSGRNANTRVWQIQKVVDDVDVTTMAMSQVTVTRFVTEKADGLCFQDTANNWQVSVESIQSTENGTYQALQGPYQIQFGAGLDTQWPIGYTVNGKIMQLGLRYLAFYDKGNNTLQPLGAINAVPPTLQGNTLTYTNIFPGIDLSFCYGKGSFQQNLIVRSLQALPSPSHYQMDPRTAYLVSVTEIDTSIFACSIQDYTGQTLQSGFLSGEGKDFYFADASTGQALCYVAQSPAFDSSPVKQSITMYKFLYQQNGHTYLVEGIPYSFLVSASFPVTLDYNIKTGTQTGNQVWKSGNTYYLSGTYTLSAPWTLVIEGGTVCKYTSGASITVPSGAKILSVGTTFDYVLFTSWKDTTMGDSVSTTFSTATGGDYGTAISLQSGASASSQIQYCKIAYATDGLDIYTNLNTPIQNNIIQQCSTNGIYLSLNGTNSRITVMNNLIYSGSRYISFPTGIYAIANDTVAYVVALNNTVDGAGTGNGILGYNGAFVDCRNNLITNCFYGLSAVNGFGNAHSYNKFYQDYSNYYGSIGQNTGEGSINTNPYATSANGSYYLNPSVSGATSAGDTTAAYYGLQNKTTVAPVQAPNTITASTTWSEVPRNTGIVDIGYHYDPVDVVVGNSGTYSTLTIGTSGVDSATLTILPGVVVSFWRSVSANISQLFSWNYANIIAHGHANNRIEFNTIYATGDMMTHPLGADGLYSYFIGIEIGQNLGPNSIIQNCIFRYAAAGIDLDSGTVLYHRINDNVFYDCRDGIAAVDSYVRAENNLFLAGNNNQYQILLWTISSSNDNAILRNNTLVGNGSGWYGIYGVATTNITSNVDIRNNIVSRFSTGIYLTSGYIEGTVTNNNLYNNTLDYSGDPTNSNLITANPQFANSGSGSFDGYYLASTTGDASRFPLQISGVSGMSYSFASTPPRGVKITISSYANGLSGSTQLGYATTLNGGGWSYTSTGSGLGNILITLSAGANGWTICSTDSITLLFGSNSNQVCLPKVSVYEGQVWYWAALDGSSYRVNTGMTGIYEDAWYAMNYDSNGLVQSSYNHLGTSPLVHSGDTTVRAYGSTATNQTLDSGTVNIGYHYLDRGFIEVAQNGRLFEYEDGTPYFPMGFSAKYPIIEYQDNLSLPQEDNYLAWAKAHGFNSMARGFFENPPSPYGYPDNVTTWYTVETHDSTGNTIFSDATAIWMDQHLNELDKYQMTYWLGIFTLSGVAPDSANWVAANPRSQYNFWYSGSNILYGSVTSPGQVLSEQTAIITAETTLQYYIDHWGDRAGIVLWDPMPELNYIGDISTTSAVNDSIKENWVTQIAGFIKNYELQKWGHGHIVSVSSGASNPGPIGSDIDYPTARIRPMYAKSQGLDIAVPLSAVNTGNSTAYTKPIYFQHPLLDVVATHPVYVTVTTAPYGVVTTLPISFPLWIQATTAGPGSNWYDATSPQYLIDSACIEAGIDMFQTIKLAFSMETSSKPYICTFMGPGDYEGPWTLSPQYWGDTTYDNATGLSASAVNLVDRHINENLYDEYFHFMGWANIASGAAGEGYHYGMYVNNKFASTFPGNVTYLTQYTTLPPYYVNEPPYLNEYNGFDDNMMNDHLARATIINQFNWAGITQWVNQNGSTGRISFSGTSSESIVPIYSGDSQNLLIWLIQDSRSLYQTPPPLANTYMQISAFPPGSYQLTWYNSTTGVSVSTTVNLTWNSYTDVESTPIPTFFRDIVAIIKPE